MSAYLGLDEVIGPEEGTVNELQRHYSAVRTQ